MSSAAEIAARPEPARRDRRLPLAWQGTSGRYVDAATAAAAALHVAIAAVQRMDYLLTWNCAHIANAALRPMIQSVCAAVGYVSPVICTPQELMEDQRHVA